MEEMKWVFYLFIYFLIYFLFMRKGKPVPARKPPVPKPPEASPLKEINRLIKKDAKSELVENPLYIPQKNKSRIRDLMEKESIRKAFLLSEIFRNPYSR